MKMNIPNQLTMLRMILVPVFVACIIYINDPFVCGIVTAIVFGLTALTDMLDGKIARKYNLITNFGKFMDSVADKFMMFSAMLTLTAKFAPYVNLFEVKANACILFHVLLWSTIIMFLRELGVTSIRLVCAGTDVGVIPANYFGKLKTVFQMSSVVIILLEYAINESGKLGGFNTYYIASYISLAAMVFMTIASGINYMKIYGKYIDTNN